MDITAQVAGPQPDFNLASEGLRNASQELGKCANLPALRQGDDILRAIENLGTRIDRRFDRLEERVGGLERRVGGLERSVADVQTALQASNHNSFARLQNSRLSSRQARLTSLHDQHNNPIPHFPSTSQALERLRVEELNMMLAGLGSDPMGDRAAKITEIRLLIGLKPESA